MFRAERRTNSCDRHRRESRLSADLRHNQVAQDTVHVGAVGESRGGAVNGDQAEQHARGDRVPVASN